VPFVPDTNNLLVRTSAEKDSDPLRTKKLEFPDNIPFWVNPTEMTLLATALLFFTVTNFVTYPKPISVVDPSATFDDVTNGIPDI